MQKNNKAVRMLEDQIDVLILLVRAGVDFPTSWDLAERWSEKEQGWSSVVRCHTRPMVEHFTRARGNFPQYSYWFRLLEELNYTGSELLPSLRGFQSFLRKEKRRRLEEQTRRLPSRLSLVMIVFYLPAFLLLSFAPLYASLAGSW